VKEVKEIVYCPHCRRLCRVRYEGVRLICVECGEEVNYDGPPVKVSEKCVVLLSGGVDSSVLLYSLIAEYECYPFTINYGQRHKNEIAAARKVCAARGDWLADRWQYLDLSVLRGLLPSALTDASRGIPEGHYAQENMAQTVVPNRNMIFLSIAAGYAEGMGASRVAYAAHSEDHYIYPDCRPEFIESVGETIKLATNVTLIEPFTYKTKAEIVSLGKKLNVPLKLTWSCYKGVDRPCLRCGSCVERTLAFLQVDFPDPALSNAEWEAAVEYARSKS